MVILVGAAVLVLWLVGGSVAWTWLVAAGMRFEAADEKTSRAEPGITQAA